jgi:anti-anti-sigma regulatory factor
VSGETGGQKQATRVDGDANSTPNSGQQIVGQWLDRVLREENATAADPVTLSIDESLDIRGVAGLRARLLAMFDNADILVIDLAKVSAIDAAGVQLLVSAQCHATRCGKRLEWSEPSAAVISAAASLGLQEALAFG